MLLFQIVIGIINILLGILIIVFRNNISRSHFFYVLRIGRSFEDAFGRENGPKWVFALGLVPLVMGIVLIILGILNINIYSL